ncbi:hypothetical protein WR25_22348 isoform C [Diploscapter pachys]|nr:hypothetical protein WR25_22348 isoform B [Diploscapter pachys]PAV86368.1 hypothetical protein WR25_22348 isoform C [Diploscapter pachys]
MLSAANDILSNGKKSEETKSCREKITHRDCHAMSTGSVLLADILPGLIVKLTAPLYVQAIPFGLRHLIVVSLQFMSFFTVATSETVGMALFGTVLASIGSSLGEISYLSLASHFDNQIISMWSSGTGGAGIFGALAYAVLTDPFLLNISPRNALLSMLVLPIVFAVTYWLVLIVPTHIHRVSILRIRTYLVPNSSEQGRLGSRVAFERVEAQETSEDYRPLILSDSEDEESHHQSAHNRFGIREKIELAKPLVRFMLPLGLVYLAEYFINQGIFELLEFDCAHGFGLTPASQYRWYQVLYQLGVFVSRSSSDIITIKSVNLPLLALLQLLNAGLFFYDSLYFYVPHIFPMMLIIFYEGLLGGASYVNTFRAVHDEIPPSAREFSMGFVSISDTVGIVMAGLLAIPTHNYICGTPIL